MIMKFTFPIFFKDLSMNNGSKITFIEKAKIDSLPQDESLKYLH